MSLRDSFLSYHQYCPYNIIYVFCIFSVLYVPVLLTICNLLGTSKSRDKKLSRSDFVQLVKDITLKTSTFRQSKFILYTNRHKGRHFVIYIFRPFFLWLSLPVQIRQRTFYSGNCIGTHMGVYFRRF